MASASAGSKVTVGTDATELFNGATNGGGCTSFCVRNRSTSTKDLLVNIPSLHSTNEWIGLPPGTTQIFRLNNNGIGSVWAKGDGGSCTVDFGVVARTEDD